MTEIQDLLNPKLVETDIYSDSLISPQSEGLSDSTECESKLILYYSTSLCACGVAGNEKESLEVFG